MTKTKLDALWRQTFVDKIITRYATYKSNRRVKKRADENLLTLKTPDKFRPLTVSDVPLVFLCHDDKYILRAFLSHYRALGVTRFICVDDQSTDGTSEYLSLQADVDVWFSTVRYKDAKRGRAWREELFRRYGSGRWYLNVDSDEFLVYDDCGRISLPDLFKILEAKSIGRVAAPMIDMYPSGQIDDAAFSENMDAMPWHIANSFDGDGYECIKNSRFIRIKGGVRRRMFGSNLDLMKYPVMFLDDRASLGENIHQPLPFNQNFCPVFGALLHFKFFADYKDRIQDAINDAQYFDGAREYVNIMGKLSESERIDFVYPGSVCYSGPEQLKELGFIAPIR